MRLLRSAVVLAVLAGLGAGAWRWSREVRKPARQPERIPVAEAKATDFEVTLLVTGTLEPAGVHPVVALETGGKVSYAVRDGSRVKPGDVIVKLDTAEIQERLDSVLDRLKQAEERLDKARRDGEKSIENAKSAVATAQEKDALTRAQNAADLEKARAELDHARGEAEYAEGQFLKMQRLFEQGLATREQLDREEENVRKQRFAFEKAERDLAKVTREAAERERSARMDLEKARLDLADAEAGRERSVKAAENAVEGQRRELEEVRRRMEGTTLRTGVGGVVLLGEQWDENGPHPLREGDEVWQGMQVALVVDPAHVRVDCEIEEIDIRRIKAGQKVRLRAETAQGRVYMGKLESIDSIATELPWWRGGTPGKKTFSALVAVHAADGRLKPGITAWLEIVVASVKGKIAVPLEAVFYEGGKPVVYRKRAAGYEKVLVTLGPRNDLYCVVLRGLRPGDKVARRRPRLTMESAPHRA